MLLIFMGAFLPFFILLQTRQPRQMKDDMCIYYLKPKKETEELSLLNFYS